jgi:hypothetical protein
MIDFVSHGRSAGSAAIAAAAFLCLTAASAAGGQAGLGKVLTTKDGGQIYGFDINQAGDDGVLASAQNAGGNGDYRVSVETFDQNNGKITHTFAKYVGPRNSYAVDGIFAGDVGLITHYIVPKGTIYAKRKYQVMNPVTANKFTGDWTPPLHDVDIQGAAVNQTTSTSAFFVIELKKQDRPDLIVSDVASNTFTNVIPLNAQTFGVGNGPLLGQYTSANQAVFALSPDGGTVGGLPPLNVLIDLSTGQTKQFSGYNNGAFHAGYVNGLAVDPNTGVAVTTTELNSQVEFYDLNARKGIAAVQLPCTSDTDQTNSGSNIAVDPVNKLFLVTDYFYCDGSQGSAIVVYDEAGNLVETITGFKFAIGEPAPVVNPSKRMGWAFGGPGGFSQLQQFFY